MINDRKLCGFNVAELHSLGYRSQNFKTKMRVDPTFTRDTAAVMNHHDQSNLGRKERFILLTPPHSLKEASTGTQMLEAGTGGRN